MEHVLEPQPPLNLSQFLDEYKKMLTNSNVPFYLAPDPPISPIAAASWLNRLASPDDNTTISTFVAGDETQRINILKPQKERYVPKTYTAMTAHKAKSRHNPFTRIQYSSRLVAEPTVNDNNDCVALKEFELKITARFYRPPRASHRGFKVESPVFAEEFECLGSNYLSELRDKISCICKGKRFVDISEDPEAPLPKLDTDPAYFFINNTFYNDTRNPNNCDYSKTVSNWARNAQGLQQEEFQFASMESTRLIELTVSLGTPLQYLHHGNCEHLFVFSQVDVLKPHPSTFLNRSLYPLKRSYNVFNRRPCNMCGQNGFQFIVEQSNRQLHDPSYLCRSCFYSFNYVDGKKVGQFKAYRIYDYIEALEDEPECQPQDKEQQDNSSSSSDESADLSSALNELLT